MLDLIEGHWGTAYHPFSLEINHDLNSQKKMLDLIRCFGELHIRTLEVDGQPK